MSVAATTDRNLSGYLLVFMAGVLWSTVGLGIRLIEDAAVWQILFYRSISMSVFLYVVVRLRTGRAPLTLIRAMGRPGLVAGAALVAAYTGGIAAIQSTSVANAMMLFAAAPLIAAVLGRVVLSESVRPATWIAIVVAACGIAVMVWDKTSGAALRGNLAALGSALGFAVFTVALRRGRAVEMMPAVLLSGMIGTVVMATICLALGLSLSLAPRDAGIAAGMGVFQVGAGLVLYTIGSRSVPAAELTLLSMSEVVLGPVWVWLLLGERAEATTLAGGAILLAAIAGNALSGARRKRPPPIP